MKKLFTCLAVVLFGAAMWSCSPYDDEELREAVDDLNDRVEAMEEAVRNANSGIETLRKLVEALQKNMTVTSVIETENGYTINFSDGTTATITNGTNAPSISVIKDEDGLYYWALDGRIIEIDGRKIKAEGSDGITPQLRINSDTKEWEMSLDGTTWTPMGVTAEGQDGDSLFSKVEDGDTEVVFTLSDGKTTIVIPKTSTAGFAFVFPETLPRGGTNVDNYYLFAFGEERELPFTGDVATVDLMHVPQGCQNGHGNGPGVRQLLLYGRHPFTHRHRPCRADDAGIGTYRGSGLLRPGGNIRSQRRQSVVGQRVGHLHHIRRTPHQLRLLAHERY